jgi:Carboxypeptidase regulatory-like domain
MQQGREKSRVLAAVKPAQESGKDEFTHPIPRRSVLQAVYWPLVVAFACAILSPAGRSQVTATLSGTVADQSGGVIPGAQVTLTNEATKDSRIEQTNAAGLYAFPSLVPGSYDIKASAKGFKSKEVTGIVLNAGDTRSVPALNLTVGAASETVTVSAASEMIPVENGSKVDVLSSEDIETLALLGRDTTELLKVLPGATTVSGGLTQDSPMFSDLNINVQQSSIGNGINISGAIYRSGTSLLSDGANIIDVGNMGSSLAIVDPEMTAQVSVQASNFGADMPFGPVVVSTISRSGSTNYHGDGYFNARNSVLNANDWQDNHSGTPAAAQHYYYPGGSFGGPVPKTNKRLLFWGGYERWLQNQGNGNVLSSYIPTPEMMQGDFSEDNTDNQTLCPNGFFPSPSGNYPQGPWCSDLGGTVFAAGTTTATATPSASLPSYGSAGGDYGQKFPMGTTFLDPGGAALAKIWPKVYTSPGVTSAAAGYINPATPGFSGVNYRQGILNVNDGWVYRVRLDYNWGDNTKIYGSYEQAFNSDLAQGNGAHLYWTPGTAIPFPGGGEQQRFRGKSMAGHVVHNFSSTTTNDFMAAWAFGSFPFTEPNPSAATRATLGYPDSYGKVFPPPSGEAIGQLNIPAYSNAGNATFPDFSQASIFSNPLGQYAVRKEAPQFADTLTKVWGRHTIKLGGFTQTTDNYQSTFGSFLDGNLSYGGEAPDAVNGLGEEGSPHNTTANFVMGIASNYSENNTAPIADLAYMSTAAFVDDTWKASSHLTLDLGIRMEHVGHWYDRDKVGMPVFYPGRVLQDYYNGKYAPGFYWHAIDAGVPLSGQPNRFVYPDARFGLSYDVFGTGNTVVRGGWGVYRFVTQTNTPGGILPTAQQQLGYGLPGAHDIQLRNIGSLAYTSCPSANQPPPCGVQGGQDGLDPSDYGQPMTIAYNLTIDQRTPWNSLFEIAYVGNQTSQLSDDAEDVEGSNYSELANQNKTPIGAFFAADPVTGIISTNPENLGQQTSGATIANKAADYRPFGIAYGTNAVIMAQNTAWSNYNGLQVSWIKSTGRLTFDLNTTWSKALGTSLQENPYKVGANYGPMNIDRPWVFNSSYAYNSGTLHTGSNLLNQLAGGWTISGISTWQAGGYVPAELGDGVPSFGMTLSYVNLPANAGTNGITSAIGDPTYFGTDETIPIIPTLTCNPTQGLAHYQILNGKCFNAPAVGTQGGQKFPYMRAMSYFDNDLAIYRTFHIHERQQIQIRASAFDWLNHPLTQFSGLGPLTVNYHVDYASHAITPNFNQTSTASSLGPPFGVMDTKSQYPYMRVIELDAKYSF